MNEKKQEMTFDHLLKMCDNFEYGYLDSTLNEVTVRELFESPQRFSTMLYRYEYGKLYSELKKALDKAKHNFEKMQSSTNNRFNENDFVEILNNVLNEVRKIVFDCVFGDSLNNYCQIGDNLRASQLHDAQRLFYRDIKNIVIVEDK